MTRLIILPLVFILLHCKTHGQPSLKASGEYFAEPIMMDSLSTVFIPVLYDAKLFSSEKIAVFGNYYANIIVYDFKVDATKVRSFSNQTITMTNSSTTTFHRLFGDSNPPAQTGNEVSAIVNSGDNLGFRNAFNKPVGGGYVAAFDYNGDGRIDIADFGQFSIRFFTILP